MELVELMGVPECKVMEFLRALDRERRLETVTLMQRGIDGKVHPKPGYRVKKVPAK